MLSDQQTFEAYATLTNFAYRLLPFHAAGPFRVIVPFITHVVKEERDLRRWIGEALAVAIDESFFIRSAQTFLEGAPPDALVPDSKSN
jgi:hypothetical protein